MKKKNKNGFILTEALIVATFVSSVLIFLYIQFKNINRNYQISYTYNTVNGLYIANVIKNYIEDESNSNLFDELSNFQSTSTDYKIVYSGDGSGCNISDSAYCGALMSASNVKSFVFASANSHIFSSVTALSSEDSLSQKFKDFVYATNIGEEDDYRILLEFNDDTYASLLIIR